MAEPWTTIGRVRSANPRAREVRIDVLGGYDRAFGELAWIRFARSAEAPLRCKVTRVRRDGDAVIVALGPGLPRDIVGQLRGANVIALPEEIPARPGQGWRLAELVGMAVVEAGGKAFGTVTEVFEGPANDAIAVERPDGRRCLLPAIPEVIVVVDLDGRTIEVGDVAPFIVEA